MGARKTGGKRKRKARFEARKKGFTPFSVFKSTAELRRVTREKDTKPVVLIVCEGSETEPNYFRELRDYRKLPKTSIDIIGGKECGTDPWNIVKYARRRKVEIKFETGFSYNAVWCVFDCNSHDQVNRDRAFNQARTNVINIAYSNPCFELWYLLHFKKQTGEIHRDDCMRELKQSDRISDYNKSKSGLYAILLEKQSSAAGYAEELRILNIGNGKKETDNPSTGVDKLVKFLNGLKGA